MLHHPPLPPQPAPYHAQNSKCQQTVPLPCPPPWQQAPLLLQLCSFLSPHPQQPTAPAETGADASVSLMPRPTFHFCPLVPPALARTSSPSPPPHTLPSLFASVYSYCPPSLHVSPFPLHEWLSPSATVSARPRSGVPLFVSSCGSLNPLCLPCWAKILTASLHVELTVSLALCLCPSLPVSVSMSSVFFPPLSLPLWKACFPSFFPFMPCNLQFCY